MTSTTGARVNFGSRLDSIGWGILFLMSGVLLLLPGVPDGSWLAGVGAILLGLNAVRSLSGLPVDWFAVILGIIALACGAGMIAGVAVPGFALFMVLCGLALVAGQVVRLGRAA
jgi:hypothetical protein